MKILFYVALAFALFTELAHSADKIPAGLVAHFDLAECPSGFSPVAAAPGRFLVGVGNLGADTYTLAGTGGEARHVLTVSEIPAHKHGITTVHPEDSGSFAGFVPGSNGPSMKAAWQNGSFFTNDSTGGGEAHENRPPYLAMLVCSLDDDFSGGGMDPELFVWAIVCLCFAAGVIAGQQR